MGGDRNHPGKTVCTIYDNVTPNQKWGWYQILCSVPTITCPFPSQQIGALNADIAGCGVQTCDDRYTIANIDACRDKCYNSGYNCKSFSWAPIGGDRNHPDSSVCTMYNTATLNQYWGPYQILCSAVPRS